MVDGVEPASRLTVHFYGKDTETPLATMYVKNEDDLEHATMILFDPGAGALGEGEIFRGWVIGEITHKDEPSTIPEYTVEMASTEGSLKTIEDIRKWAAHFAADDANNYITEGDVVNIRAAIYKSYVVTYNDPQGISQNADSILVMPSQTGAYHYTINYNFPNR